MIGGKSSVTVAQPIRGQARGIGLVHRRVAWRSGLAIGSESITLQFQENAMAGAVRSPVIRSFSLPNGSKIVSLRESTLRAGVKAANSALKAERSLVRPSPSTAKPRV
jgi:hypothetical protein